VVLCRTVALKVLRKMEPVGLIRFMHEAQIQSRIVHPNICRIYDVDNSGGIPKIAMQLVRGPTLAGVAAELTLKEVVTLLAQVAEAIHAAHRLNLIHRDLKPSNILLERSPDGPWVPYVCDFGLAMALDEPAMTLGQGLLGTPAFMAPEQLLGERRLVGPATDIFALGSTLHFAIYLEPPPGLAGPLDLKRTGVFPPARHGHPDLPRDLETILRKCLEPEPELRYASALALAEDLWLFAAGAPIQARPVGLVEHRWRQFRRYRLLALGACLALAGIAAGRLVEMDRLTRAQEAQAEQVRSFVLEAADLEKQVRLEKMLPVHDMRPTYGRVRARMAEIQAQIPRLGPGAEGPGHFALGRARFMLRDFPGALREFETAWKLGFQAPEAAWFLARSLVATEHEADAAAIYSTGQPSPSSAQVAQRAQALFARGMAAEADPPQFAQALIAYTLRDYAKAAARAHASFMEHPWHFESATIEALSLSALGRQHYDAGDLAGAEGRYQEAMAAARRFIAVGHSDAFIYHVYFQAAERLAYLQASRGQLALAFLDDLTRQCEQAQILDPTQPDLQDDRVLFLLLRAMRLWESGRDPGTDLDSAQVFLDTWARAPLSVPLRADRMWLRWRQAEQSFAESGEPIPDLGTVLSDPGHTNLFRPRDLLPEILNFKARVEASQGKDPRPTLADALRQVPADPEAVQSWTQSETAAESWLQRARWEAVHGLDPGASLRRSQELLDLTLRINDRSAPALALEGLAETLEGQVSPGRREQLLAQARNHLRQSLAQGPSARLQGELREALAGAPPGEQARRQDRSAEMP
jgi:serine/threonine-protein kinase